MFWDTTKHAATITAAIFSVRRERSSQRRRKAVSRRSPARHTRPGATRGFFLTPSTPHQSVYRATFSSVRWTITYSTNTTITLYQKTICTKAFYCRCGRPSITQSEIYETSATLDMTLGIIVNSRMKNIGRATSRAVSYPPRRSDRIA